MKVNESNTERIVRVIIGLGLLYVAFALVGAPWNWVAGVLGVVMLVTSAIGYCPLYDLFKIKK